ncbi:MAG: glucose-6-phosphate dehydrogenase [Thermodesulfobacteriota bacterium]
MPHSPDTAPVCHQDGVRTAEPCAVVIFGASGDLTARKLIPSLFALYESGRLPDPFFVVGVARTPLDHEGFRRGLEEDNATAILHNRDAWLRFAGRLYYHPLDYDDGAAYPRLAAELDRLDREVGTGGNRIFYLAVPPSVSPRIAARLGECGLAGGVPGGWARIVVEKPFGSDLESALALDRIMHRSFREEQIFRIDHYLAKETVQNILMFRFANAIFEPVWNRGFVDYVGIVAAEQLGIENRAGYYEQAGVIRDMFQNHLMQLLSLVAMEPPSMFRAARVQDEKVKVFRSMRPFSEARPEENLILGQYDGGSPGGVAAVPYREEPGVRPDSLTPTYAMLRLFIDNWRWRDVPFYLVSGKRLKEKITRVVVQFRDIPHSMFRHLLGEGINANRLTLGIHPDENIRLTFQAKVPGPRICMQTVAMDFAYGGGGPKVDSYARVLLDCIAGDHMLFWRQDGVEETWSHLDPILLECEHCSNRAGLLHRYGAGSWGPEAAWKWMRLIVGDHG